MTDALVYAVMKNIMDPTDKDWDYYKNNFQSPTPHGLPDTLNIILDKTTIRRACCLAKQAKLGPNYQNSWFTKVRIPQPKGYTYGADEEIEKKYGYIDKHINIPKSLCESAYKITMGNDASYDYCNDFMKLYCDNIIKDYKKLNNNVIDYTKFKNYKPECACYLEYPIGLGIPDGIPPKCVLPGCNRTSAYVDPERNKDTCSLTICNANVNFGNISARDIKEFKNTITQNCGGKAPTYRDDKCKIQGCKPGNCSDDGLTCTKCVDKYYTTDGGKTCIPRSNCQDRHCKSCKDDGTDCTVCNDGFYLKAGICTSCPTGCITCSTGGTCTNCEDNYALIGGECKACTDKNCITCNDDIGKCTLCKSGFAPVNGKCVSCSVGNCKTCDGTAGNADTCDTCKDGFYLDKNICNTCSGNNCLKCSDVDTCTECKPGYDLKNKKCVKKESKTLIYAIGGGVSICLSVIVVIIILFIIFYSKKHKH